jgi:penicillin amidase
VKRHTTVLLLLLTCFSSFLPSSPRVTAQQTADTTASANTLSLAGLRAEVTVRRDERGIPYIEAANEADLYFAQGYVVASDRLWEMDFLRRTARGELAEIFGRVVLEEDKRRRLYGFGGLSEAMMARTSPQVHASLEAYARGVNAYIESLDAQRLPIEFQILGYKPLPWSPADSLLVGKIFAEVLSTTWDTDIMRAALTSLPADKRKALLPETSPLDVVIVGNDKNAKRAKASSSRQKLPGNVTVDDGTLAEVAAIKETMARSLERVGLFIEDGAVSNNWVVAGSRTVSGKPLLANDPHLPATAPSIWYMAHLSAPGLRVAGVTPPGAPGIILGHNEQIAWGATNLGPDVQDLYLEKFDPNNPRRYMTPAGWRDAVVRTEEIKVRKSFTDASTETVNYDVTVTRHGPIFFEKNGQRYALRWTALDSEAVEFEAFYYLNRARNWNEFRAAFKDYRGPTQNFIYADTSGHIGYYGAGPIPIRKTGDGSLPYDGATDDGEWTGFIPYDKLPQLYDPPNGIIVTANNRVVGQDYPFHLTHEWAAPYRARRIYDLLTAKKKLTPDDFRAVQGDTHSIPNLLFARTFVKLIRQSVSFADNPKTAETIRLLEGWDGRADAESRAAPLAVVMRDRFRQRILVAALGEELAKQYSWGNVHTFLDRIIEEQPREWLPKEFKDYAELMRACEREAREAIAKRLGADETQWTWGRYQTMRFQHPLASVPLIGQQFVIPPLPQNGIGSSPNVGSSVSMRHIADPGNWDRTQLGIALGQSGKPSSPHWTDQLADWRAVTPRVFPFTTAAVTAASKETVVLRPK